MINERWQVLKTRLCFGLRSFEVRSVTLKPLTKLTNVEVEISGHCVGFIANVMTSATARYVYASSCAVEKPSGP